MSTIQRNVKTDAGTHPDCHGNSRMSTTCSSAKQPIVIQNQKCRLKSHQLQDHRACCELRLRTSCVCWCNNEVEDETSMERKSMSESEMKAEMERLRAENARLKNKGAVGCCFTLRNGT